VRVTAGRETGHRTHGDGTAADLVPATGTAQRDWDVTVGRLARDLGWTASCGSSGARPACPLKPAIQWIGYDGYPEPRLAANVPRRLPGTHPPLVGVGLLRIERARDPVRVGHGVQRPEQRRRRRRCRRAVSGQRHAGGRARRPRFRTRPIQESSSRPAASGARGRTRGRARLRAWSGIVVGANRPDSRGSTGRDRPFTRRSLWTRRRRAWTAGAGSR
jgi:hypothetical protein